MRMGAGTPPSEVSHVLSGLGGYVRELMMEFDNRNTGPEDDKIDCFSITPSRLLSGFLVMYRCSCNNADSYTA